MKTYDIIIAGAGCAGLSLLVRLLQSGRYSEKKILLVDKGPKDKNDRTWCFWETGAGYFDKLVCQQWSKLRFYSPAFSSCQNISPYRYKMIRGIDFYEYCFSVIQAHKNVTVKYGVIKETFQTDQEAGIILDETVFSADYLFNSLPPAQAINGNGQINLLQHFKGWIIKTGEPSFDPEEAILMDFRVTQQQGTTFAYTLPLSSMSALVEYTLFSASPLSVDEYEKGLHQYIRDVLNISHYHIREEETGIIPMTSYRFPSREGRIVYIGTAGGQTKASTGYTFRFIQKQAEALTSLLVDDKPLTGMPATPSRFRFYDNILLQLLAKGRPEGAEIFSRLFLRNDMPSIFKFLDNETSFSEELRLIRTLQIFPFLTAAIKQIF